MSNIREIAPSNLANIPMMLRFWAAELEAGHEPMPRTALLVMIGDGDTPPTIASFGQELSRLEEVGALTCAAGLAIQTELVPDDG